MYAGGGVVTNTGVIEADPGDTGVVMIDGPFDNQGSTPGGVVADSNVTVDGNFTNEGTVWVAAGTTFTDEYIMTNNAGTIADAGTFNVTNEFIENDGTATGIPDNVVDAALYFTGTGASSFTVVGPDESTLHGDIASGQTLTLAPGSSIYAYATPLVNSGVIDAESTTAGTSIVGSVQNDGTFIVGSGSPTTIESGSFTQQGTGTTQVDLGDPVNYGRLTVAGTASLDGQLVTSTSFTPMAGTGFSIINSTGALSGTFSSYAFGSQPYTIAYTPNSVEITGATGLAVTTTSLPPGQVASPYTATLTSSGGVGAVSWAVTSGALPAGLSLNTSTGAITGAPTAPGLTTFTVTATDSSTPTPQTTSALLSISVATSGLVVTTTSLPAGEVNDPYPGATLASTGGTAPVTWKVTSGALPAGLSLNAGTGAITGTPTAAGTKTFSVTATDSTSPTAETSRTNLSITVEAALAVTTKTLPGGQDGSVYLGATLASTGGTAPVTWTVSNGALPAGLTLNPSGGAITGTPTGAGAVDSFTVAATDSTAPAAADRDSQPVDQDLQRHPGDRPARIATGGHRRWRLSGSDARLDRGDRPGHLGGDDRETPRRADSQPEQRGDHRDAHRGRHQVVHGGRDGFDLPEGRNGHRQPVDQCRRRSQRHDQVVAHRAGRHCLSRGDARVRRAGPPPSPGGSAPGPSPPVSPSTRIAGRSPGRPRGRARSPRSR